jgi:aspartate racemase
MHKKIGIIGGLSPESTVSYYLHITRSYVEQFGDSHYPEIFIVSVDLEQYHAWRVADEWEAIANHLALSADRLQAAGADFGLIATNTMHKVFNETQKLTTLPLLSLFDPLVSNIIENNVRTVGLLGTTTTMADPFYADELARHGVRTLVPTPEQQEEIHRIIIEELVLGKLKDASRAYYLQAMDELKTQGAQGIILGCTEIPLLITPSDTDMTLFDTAILHADAALRRAIS